MDEASLPTLKKALTSANPVKRYWAVTGMLALGKKAAYEAGDVALLLKDSSPVIRTTAAEALYQWGKKDIATKALIANVASETNSSSLLHLLNTLRRLDLLGHLPKDWAKDKAMKAGNQDYIKRFSQRMKD
jgi:HEAT repeat protein